MYSNNNAIHINWSWSCWTKTTMAWKKTRRWFIQWISIHWALSVIPSRSITISIPHSGWVEAALCRRGNCTQCAVVGATAIHASSSVVGWAGIYNHDRPRNYEWRNYNYYYNVWPTGQQTWMLIIRMLCYCASCVKFFGKIKTPTTFSQTHYHLLKDFAYPGLFLEQNAHLVTLFRVMICVPWFSIN